MPPLLPGTKIQETYLVVKLIGEGGMNRVYLVETLDRKRRFALKVSKEAAEVQSSQQEIYNQFLKEISVLTTLSHPAMPRVEEYFAMGNVYCIVEEYIGGMSLERFLEKNRPTELEVMSWALTVCDVLEMLHENNIIFRDLKPANIILTKKKNVKLIDFDIARHFKKGKLVDTSLLGTPGYAAPETYGKAQSDARSDIYSLGATLHHLLSGVDPQDKPFQFEPIERLRPGISAPLAAIVKKALQNKPEKRYRNVREIRKALQSDYIRQGGTPPGAVSSAGQHGTTKSCQKNPTPKKKKDGCLLSCFVMFILFVITMAIIGDRESTLVLDTDRIVVRKLEHPPQFLVSDEWSRNFAGMGEGLTPYRDTYVFYPEDVGEPEVELTPLCVRDTTSLASKIRFRVRGGTHSTAPLDHVLSIRFAMPLNNEYPEGRGSFAVIPGKFNSFTVETRMKCEKMRNRSGFM
jgi:serine/threonine protein kinase